MIIRSVIWKAVFYCCYGGNIVTPKPSAFENKQFVETFDTIPTESLQGWADRVANEKADKMGQESCSELASNFSVCNLSVNIVSTEEIIEIVEIVPQDVLDRIERLEGLIMDSNNTIAEYTEQIANILAKKEEERTVEDKEKLIRLDGYIRSENESIRKFESEIKRLKTEWKIE